MTETSSTPAARLMDVNEACERLNLSRTYLYRLMAEGKLRFAQVGKRRMVSEAALSEFIRSVESNA